MASRPSAKSKLAEYDRKRDFAKTAEPKGKVAAKKKAGHRFVIQKHDASRLHYDLRLEMEGTLKSWAVPKGLPFAKGAKSLAVEVEDHPVAYIDFEGTIPQGQYGGGTVMVWDQGTYEALSDDPPAELAGGKLHFVLKGSKLQGEWYLVRLKEENQWLVIRANDDFPPVSARLDDTSAASGKTMGQLAEGDRVWQSNTTTTPAKAASGKKLGDVPLPAFVTPMQAQSSEIPSTGDWLYEIKFDGWRALALKGGSQTRLISRNEKDFGGKFPEIMDALAQLDVTDAILDGEIVAMDEEGRSSFQLLQAYDMGEERPPILFYAFDLLHLNGKNLRDQPLTERKAKLEKLLQKAPGTLRYSASLDSPIQPLLEQVRKLGLEGLIGKKPDSLYESGKRSSSWIKLKLLQEQEFVIGGYSAPSGTRKHFGAILVGYYRDSKLHFVAKVGTGFNDKLLTSLHSEFKKLPRAECPFVNLPEKRSGKWGQGVTASEMKKCTWTEPTLVCQVKFSEWTRDDRLRQPVFLGLRQDKTASEVLREILPVLS